MTTMNNILTFRRSRHGRLCGVLQGVANATGTNVAALRLAFVVIVLFVPVLSTFAIAAYITAWLLTKPEPSRPLRPEEEEFYNCVTTNRHLALVRLSNRLDALDKRARNVETIFSARGDEWDKRMKQKEQS